VIHLPGQQRRIESRIERVEDSVQRRHRVVGLDHFGRVGQHHADGRITTDTPLQRLFFLNSEFVINQAKALVSRLETMQTAGTEAKIRQAYRLLFQREPGQDEVQAGFKFLESGPNKWPLYAQALMSSTEFILVN